MYCYRYLIISVPALPLFDKNIIDKNINNNKNFNSFFNVRASKKEKERERRGETEQRK
jgi:hypothetical protein